MNILYSVKSYPVREHAIARELKNIQASYIDAVAFSRRTFLDLDQVNKVPVFDNVYDFTNYCEKKDDAGKLSIEEIDDCLFCMEDKYGIPINKALYADRTIIKYDREKQRRILYALVSFLIDLMQNNHYNVVIGELSSASDVILYYLCEHYSVPYIFFWHGRIKNKIEFSNIEGKRLGLKELYDNYKNNGVTSEDREEIQNFLNEFNSKMTPDYMKFSSQTSIKAVFKKEYKESKIKRLIKVAKAYNVDRNYSVDMSISIKEKIISKMKKLYLPIKKVIANRYYDKVDLSNKYFLVPLHFQPESSTMTFAQSYLNQITFIENLSKSIPGGTYLYVKEHPAMFLDRSFNFYKHLIKIPNVKVIGPSVNTNELLKSCIGVITLTNTTGFEAIVLDKPVFVFGNVFYQEYDFAFKCSNYEELRMNIDKTLNWSSNIENRIQNRNYFILAMIQSLSNGNLNSHIYDPNVLSEENTKAIAKAIYNRISIEQANSNS